MFFLLLIAAAALCLGGFALLAWRRIRRREASADEVIYLGYDDQDNVSSMRSTLLERLDRADLDV